MMKRRKKNPITSHSEFTQDLIVEVLRILEAKSVLRFRCVSKSWNSLISDPSFARLHLNKRSRLLLFDGNERHFYRTADYEAVEKIGISIEACARRSFPFQLTSGLRIWGSCNGIICFGVGVKDVNLWNPTTGEVYILPKPHDRKGWDARFGFGWDKSVNDYKVVRVMFSESSERTEVEMLALKSKTWVKSVEGIDLRFESHCKKIVCFNGALHWFASSTSPRKENFVARFDLAEEKWQKFLLPRRVQPMRIAQLCVLGDCLCLCFALAFDGRKHCMLVWVMKEDRVESPWIDFTPIFCDTVNPGNFIFSSNRFIYRYLPLSLTTDGGINGFFLVVKSNTSSGLSTILIEASYRDATSADHIVDAVVLEEALVSLVALGNTP